MRNTILLLWAMLFSAGLLAGCEEPVADTLAVQKIRSVVVVPFHSSASDPSAGPVAAGICSAALQRDLGESVRVRVAPVLWRITRMQQWSLDDAEAIQLAKDLGVDSVLTGSVNLTLEPSRTDEQPESKALKAAYVPTRSVPEGQDEVTLRLLSVSSGACIYEMKGRVGGDKPTKRMNEAVNKAIDPLIQLWKRAPK